MAMYLQLKGLSLVGKYAWARSARAVGLALHARRQPQLIASAYFSKRDGSYTSSQPLAASLQCLISALQHFKSVLGFQAFMPVLLFWYV